MSHGLKIVLGIAGGPLLLGLPCSSVPQSVSEATMSLGRSGLPNPASVHCEQQAGRLEMRTVAGGGQYGVCLFPDGSQCDEWAFYRGECGPGGKAAGPSAEVVAARRDAALTYVAQHYGDQAPAPGLEWQQVLMEESVAPEGSVGQVAYGFTAGDWAVTVSYPVGMSGLIVYSMKLGNPVSGFGWAGKLDTTGQVAE